MNLYLSNGRIWTGTQKDAKAAGEFVAVDVPTDKPGLLQWLNDRWAELLHPVPPPEPEMAAVYDVVQSQPPTNAGDCPACHRSPRVAQIVVNCEASMTAQAAIADVTDTRSLDRIIAVAVARRAEL